MSNYTRTTNFTVKDSLSSGSAAKVVRGSEIDYELDAIATAVTTKLDSSTPSLVNPAISGAGTTLTGTVTCSSATIAGTTTFNNTATGTITCSSATIAGTVTLNATVTGTGLVDGGTY